MKLPLLILIALTCALSSFGQSKYAGDYIGTMSPVKWAFLERGIMGMRVYVDGSVSVEVYNYEMILAEQSSGIGQIDGKGSLNFLSSGGLLVRARISAVSGTIRGTASNALGKYTFTCLRRYRAAHDPALWEAFRE